MAQPSKIGHRVTIGKIYFVRANTAGFASGICYGAFIDS
jgi:hypothetical protein